MYEQQSSQKWTVGGNLDQIKKKPEIHDNHVWTPRFPDKIPNMVKTEFDDKAAACDLYNKMRHLKMTCSKNWID
ncbi:hypothetical protein [Flavobacterium sp.]|jgi:hypothetical protein|uniref:hypothetical protein n=1 Tax=Flavobacterium sp. TaxID=239 RepID=UPI0037BE455C